MFTSLLLLACSLSPAQAVPKVPAAALAGDYQTAETHLVGKLREPAAWSPRNDHEREVLVQNITLGGKLRMASLAPILAEHIHFTPSTLFPSGISTLEKEYPSVEAVIRIGSPAIPPLLTTLKTASPDVSENDILQVGPKRHRLAAYCLVQIYKQGGAGGAQLARARIEVEMKAATDQEKSALRRAFDYPFLKE